MRLQEEQVAMFESPVAERNDDMVELKALALMNGEYADAVGDNTLNCLAANAFFPLTNKSIDIRAVVECKLIQLVVERADISALFFETFQLEDFEETFCQFVERQVE